MMLQPWAAVKVGKKGKFLWDYTCQRNWMRCDENLYRLNFLLSFLSFIHFMTSLYFSSSLAPKLCMWTISYSLECPFTLSLWILQQTLARNEMSDVLLRWDEIGLSVRFLMSFWIWGNFILLPCIKNLIVDYHKKRFWLRLRSFDWVRVAYKIIRYQNSISIILKLCSNANL